MKIKRLTNQDKNFYATLGPFLARRDVEKELGYPIYDDDSKVWLIAFDGKKVLGFCYLQEKSKSHYQIGSCYVIEGHRHMGLFRKLFIEAMDGVIGSIVLVTKDEYLRELLVEEGFLASRTRGSFTEYIKEVGVDERV